MKDVVLQTEHLTKRYGGRVAVDRLSLRVERGDIYGFLGQNGAGKSTTIRMLLSLITPTEGTFQFFGGNTRRKSVRTRVGAIIDAPAFYENMSGRRNLSLLAALSGGTTRARIAEVLDLVGLAARADDAVRTYSQGMQDVRALVGRLRDEQGLTIMLSSHLLGEVERLCDRVGIIQEGRLVYEGDVAQLLASANTHRLRVDQVEAAYRLLADEPALVVRRNGADSLYVDAPAEAVPELNARLVAQGIRIFELAQCRETLEDVFLRLTRKGR